MSKLVVLSEGFSGRAFEIKAEKTTIGRIEDNAFQLAEQSISSHHAEVWLSGEEVMVKDLGSTNGTFINGDKITESKLKPGQTLRFGTIDLRLETPGQPNPPPMPAKKPADKAATQGGVKMTTFEQGTDKIKFDKGSAFTKKSNKVGKIFLGIGIALGVIIIVMIVFGVLKMKPGE